MGPMSRTSVKCQGLFLLHSQIILSLFALAPCTLQIMLLIGSLVISWLFPGGTNLKVISTGKQVWEITMIIVLHLLVSLRK